MRIVQYESRGHVGCGVEASGQVHPTGYPDTLALIRDGERGLAAQQCRAGGRDEQAGLEQGATVDGGHGSPVRCVGAASWRTTVWRARRAPRGAVSRGVGGR